MASTKETKRITEEEAKEQMIAELEKRGLGKKPLTFLLTGTRNNHSLRPKTRHVYTGKNGETYVFNLRYTPVSPTAIENDQNIDGPVELRRVDFPGDRWTIYPEDRGLQMFLMLHPFYGKDKVFYIEDLEADAAIEESTWTLRHLEGNHHRDEPHHPSCRYPWQAGNWNSPTGDHRDVR